MDIVTGEDASSLFPVQAYVQEVLEFLCPASFPSYYTVLWAKEVVTVSMLIIVFTGIFLQLIYMSLIA